MCVLVVPRLWRASHQHALLFRFLSMSSNGQWYTFTSIRFCSTQHCFIYFWHLWTLNKTYIYCFLQFRLIGYSLTIVFPSLSHRFIFMYPVYFYGSCIYKTKACNIKSQKDLFNQIIHSTRIPSSFGKIFPQYFLS